MSQPEARAWWADVEDLREQIESRREAELDSASPVALRLVSDDGPPAVATPRRTVQITGRPAQAPVPRPLMVERQRQPRALDAATRRPDRIAGWAALLGLVLVLVSTAMH